jgi:predicted TIM-barrel fold metal-dependent hydrolase
VEIIDAQLHEVASHKPWPHDEESRLTANVELAREAMDSVGVDMALLNAGLPFCEHAIARYPDRFVGAISTSYEDPDVKETIAGYMRRPGILAIRTRVIDWRTAMLTDDYRAGAVEPLFSAAEELGVPVFVMASGQAQAVGDIARAHPGLQLIIDHIGLPQPTPMTVGPEPWAGLPTVTDLAKYPNVAVKFSAAPTLSLEPYPHHDIWPHVHTMISAFGPGRLMWASDMTRLRMMPGTTDRGPRDVWASNYADCVGYLKHTDEVSAADKEMIFGGTIRRILRWPRG